MGKPAPPDDERIVPFADFLAKQAGGHTHDELSEGLRNLVAAVKETGKGGQLTLVVKVKPVPKAAAGTVMVEDNVTVKLPSMDRRSSVFFITADNNLSQDNPAQPQLPLRGLPGGSADVASDETAGGRA